MNLVEDRLVEPINLEPRRLRDPEEGVEYARHVLNQSAGGNGLVTARSVSVPEMTLGPFVN